VTKRLLEGSDAIAQAMIAAGCRFFAGYPMTPFTELLERMGVLLPEVGGTCINAESELEAIGMAWGAASTGTRAATGSVGQGLSLMQESLSELCQARLPVVVINMARGQGDYYQATRGGGHGDYRHIVFAPGNLAEAVRLVQQAFHLAEVWRNPALIMGDYYLGHVAETVEVERIDFGPPADKSWALTGESGGTGHARLVSMVANERLNVPGRQTYGEQLDMMGDRIAALADGVETMHESYLTDDADVVLVAYGTPARYLRQVITQLRQEGVRIGMIRPITLWPYPSKAVGDAIANAGTGLVYELNAGQMIDDVRLAVNGRAPVHFIGRPSFDEAGFGVAPDLDVERLYARVRSALDNLDTRDNRDRKAS
jgi:2-oxoglutarate ferredoxin oxidoreductase subunit alpha